MQTETECLLCRFVADAGYTRMATGLKNSTTYALVDVLIIYLQLFVIAASTRLAVKESLSSTHSAYATIIAVKLLLVNDVIKEYTTHTSVGPKSNMALLAMLADRLPCCAQSTYKLLDHFAI